MNKISFIFACLLCVSVFSKAQDKRPNIIFIIADDLGRDDVGAYGHPKIRTPNIDKLAKEGMRFDNAFLTTSSCSPSRASIITGTYPHQTDAEQLHWPVPASKITFVEKLKAAGYWTAQAGKWHLGDSIMNRFDYLAVEGSDGFVFNSPEKIAAKSDGSGSENFVSTLKKHPKGKPFFLWLASVDPHRPYKKGAIKVPHSPDDVVVPPYLPDSKEVRGDFVNYYDEVSRMDGYVGEVLKELAAEGLDKNTLIIFSSDNGRPFPREKTTLYDGGIRTPFIVRWPGKVKPGSVSNSLISSVDIAPTILSAAGLKIAPNFVGKNIAPVLSNPTAQIRDFIYAEDHWHDFEDFGRAVRNGRYKYIRNFYPDLPETTSADILRDPTYQYMLKQKADGTLDTRYMSYFYSSKPPEQLFDCEKDPYELHNLISEPAYAQIAAMMRSKLDEFWKATGDKLPERRTLDEFDRNTGLPLPNRMRPRPGKAVMSAKDFQPNKKN